MKLFGGLSAPQVVTAGLISGLSGDISLYLELRFLTPGLLFPLRSERFRVRRQTDVLVMRGGDHWESPDCVVL